jgi:hypothetical protein
VGTTTTTVRAACTDRPYGGRPGHPSFRALHRLVVAAACGDPPRRHLVRTTRCEEPPHHARACTDVAAPSAAAADAPGSDAPPQQRRCPRRARHTHPRHPYVQGRQRGGVFRPFPTRAPRDRISLRRRLVCKCTGARRLHPPTPRRHGAARCEGIAERDASAARYPDPHRTGLVAVHLITCSGTRAPKTRSAMGDRPRPAEPRTTWLPAAARPDDGLPPIIIFTAMRNSSASVHARRAGVTPLVAPADATHFHAYARELLLRSHRWRPRGNAMPSINSPALSSLPITPRNSGDQWIGLDWIGLDHWTHSSSKNEPHRTPR